MRRVDAYAQAFLSARVDPRGSTEHQGHSGVLGAGDPAMDEVLIAKRFDVSSHHLQAWPIAVGPGAGRAESLGPDTEHSVAVWRTRHHQPEGAGAQHATVGPPRQQVHA